MGFFLPLPALRGGATEKAMATLARELSSRGHDVCIYSRRWPGLADDAVVDGVRHIRLPGSAHSRHLAVNLLLDAIWSLRVMLALQKHDALISHSVFFPAIFKRLRARTARVFAWIGRMPKGQTHLYGKVDRLLVATHAVAGAIARENPTLAARTILLPPPVDYERLAATPPARDGMVTIGFIGRIHSEKGLEMLLDAAAHLAAQPQLPSWRLLIAGPWKIEEGGSGEDYRAHLEKRGASLPAGRFRMMPPCFDDKELARIYASIDVFCYPSLAEAGETLGVAPIEAMSTGAVPVLSNLECFRDLVTDQESGRTFDHRGPAPAIALAKVLAELISNQEERSRLASAARLAVRRFGVASVCGQLLHELSLALEEPSR